MPEAESINRSDIDFLGLSHIVLEVADADESAAFYQDVMALEAGPIDPWPLCGTGRILALRGNQHLILANHADRPDLRDTGVHHAYAVNQAQRHKISTKLDRLGVEIFSYSEDPPDETNGGFYFFDPSGNRVQLVTEPGQDAPEAWAMIRDMGFTIEEPPPKPQEAGAEPITVHVGS